MARSIKRLARDERGTNIVEMALVTVLLLLLAVGAGDMGRAFHTYIVITNAAREGARYGSWYPWDEGGMMDATIQEAAESGVDLSAGTIAVDGAGGVSGEPILVLVEFPYRTFLAGIWGIGSINLRHSAQMIIFGLDPLP